MWMKAFKHKRISWIVYIIVISLIVTTGCTTGIQKVPSTSEKNSDSYMNLTPELMKEAIQNEISKGKSIDDFADSTKWGGTKSKIGSLNAIELRSSGKVVESSRKYDEFLKFKNYIAFHFQVENLKNIEWMAIYLSQNTSFSDYYEVNLLPKLNEDLGIVLLNKKDLTVGKGKPKWHQISTIKIAFKTTDGKKGTLRFGNIISYDATPMCSIWFDDGWKSTYEKAYPIMKKYNLKGTLSIISSHVNYDAYCSEQQLDEMYGYGWDLVNHTVNHQNLTTLTDKQIVEEISGGYKYLNSKGYERASTQFVPPESAVNDKVNTIIKKYATSSRSIWDGYNYLPITNRYNLSFQEVDSSTTIEEVISWIDTAIDNDLYLILLFHQIDDKTSKFQYKSENFEAILQYLQSKRDLIDTVPISQVFRLGVVEEEKLNEKADLHKRMIYSKTGQWNLVWQEDFEGSRVDDTKWNILEENPYKNNELQYYIQDNVYIQNGELIIKSTKKNNQYFSGAINTDMKKTFLYGRIDVRARLPSGRGLLPAIWLLPQSENSLPEIDVIEYLGNMPNEIWHVLHYIENEEQKRAYSNIVGPDYSEDYHIYSIQWEKEVLKWLVDGKVTFSTTAFVPKEKLFLIINTAVGGNWPGDPDKTTNLPKEMKIDYIRYLTR